MKEPLPLLVPQEVEKWYKLKCYCSLYTRTLHLPEGFSFPIAASPLTDNGLKENNPLALRVKPGFKRSKALLHLYFFKQIRPVHCLYLVPPTFRTGKQKWLYIWAQTLRSLSIFLRNYGNIKIFVWSEHCKCVSGGVEQGVCGRKRVMSYLGFGDSITVP